MTDQEVLSQLDQMNESERFYREYRLAEASPASFDDWLAHVNMEWVLQEKLLLPEKVETIPPEYLDEWFFSEENEGIRVLKHNRYAPAIPHFHNFYEMFYVLRGRALHQVGEKPELLHAGDLCLIQPKVRHSIDVNDDSIVIDVLMRKSLFRHYFYTILQGDHILSTFFMSTMSDKSGMDYLIFHAPEDEELRGSFISLCREAMGQEAYCNTLINAVVIRIFVLLLRYHQDSCIYPGTHTQDDAQAECFLRYLQAHASGISLEKMAEDFHYTPEYASRRIRQLTGRTYSQLLTDIRLNNARQLLRDTSLSVYEVGASVGYESPEHFVRVFKKSFGVTPAEYRKRGK